MTCKSAVLISSFVRIVGRSCRPCGPHCVAGWMSWVSSEMCPISSGLLGLRGDVAALVLGVDLDSCIRRRQSLVGEISKIAQL